MKWLNTVSGNRRRALVGHRCRQRRNAVRANSGVGQKGDGNSRIAAAGAATPSSAMLSDDRPVEEERVSRTAKAGRNFYFRLAPRLGGRRRASRRPSTTSARLTLLFHSARNDVNASDAVFILLVIDETVAINECDAGAL